MSRTDPHTTASRLREFFLLENAQQGASAFSDSQLRTIRAYYDAGVGRLRVAQDLRGPREVQTSLTLYRQAILFLAQANLVSRDENANLGSLPQVVEQVVAPLAPSDVPSDLLEVLPLLSSNDPLVFDRLAPEDADQKAEQLERVAEWLSAAVDPRTPRQLRAARTIRLATTASVALSLLIWAIVRITAPVNLARAKPVTATSTAFASSAEAVVDGVKDGRFGLHTNMEPNAAVTIDLGADYNLTRVRVYGRGDCCYEQSVPLNLELSTDGTTFQAVAQRTEPFSESDPWEVKLPNTVARHVRLRTERNAFLVLSEVEVNGKNAKKR